MSKEKLSLNFNSVDDFQAVDIHREVTRKNLRFEKNKNLVQSSNTEGNVWVNNGAAPVQESLVIENQKMFGGNNNNSALVDWANWLPFAAKQYNISPNIRDYVVIPIPTIITDLPNRNGTGFPLPELVKFRPNLGMQSYKTWKGKPTFEEHVNEDHTVARGVIIDTHMRRIPGMNVWRLMKLLSFDRTRDPELCEDILSRKRNSYSMGAYVGGYTCSICNAEFGTCNHIPLGVSKKDVLFMPHRATGRLLFKNVLEPEGFETSAVKTPAFISALNDNVFDMSQFFGEEVAESSVIQMANLNSVLKYGKSVK